MSTLPLAPGFAADGPLALSALEQGARIADGSLTSAALVDLYLARIRQHNPTVNAFISVFEHAARRDAEQADRLRAQGRLLGPFHGVPTAVKDHYLIRGRRMRVGSRAFSWLWSPVDDPMVRSLRAGGFVLLGQTAMSELGILPVTETELQPPTRNPWDLSRTAGGSSGGAGAAVAAGLVPIAPGSDGAGSVRIPSALNGLFGLKTTPGVLAKATDRLNRDGLAVIGPLARTLDDAAAMLDVLTTPERRQYLVQSRRPVRPLRIGLLLDSPVATVDARIAARVQAAADQLRAAGHHVELRTHPPTSVDDFLPVYQRMVGRIPILTPSRLGPFAHWFWTTGRHVSEVDSAHRLAEMRAAGNAFLNGLDVVLSPTVGQLPPRAGEFAGLTERAHFDALAPLGAFTALANVMGVPALSVPFGEVEGLPVAVQLLGRAGTDAELLALGRTLRR